MRPQLLAVVICGFIVVSHALEDGQDPKERLKEMLTELEERVAGQVGARGRPRFTAASSSDEERMTMTGMSPTITVNSDGAVTGSGQLIETVPSGPPSLEKGELMLPSMENDKVTMTAKPAPSGDGTVAPPKKPTLKTPQVLQEMWAEKIAAMRSDQIDAKATVTEKSARDSFEAMREKMPKFNMKREAHDDENKVTLSLPLQWSEMIEKANVPDNVKNAAASHIQALVASSRAHAQMKPQPITPQPIYREQMFMVLPPPPHPQIMMARAMGEEQNVEGGAEPQHHIHTHYTHYSTCVWLMVIAALAIGTGLFRSSKLELGFHVYSYNEDKSLTVYSVLKCKARRVRAQNIQPREVRIGKEFMENTSVTESDRYV